MAIAPLVSAVKRHPPEFPVGNGFPHTRQLHQNIVKQRGCAGFQLDRAGAVRVARFVCSGSSAASASGGTSGSNAPTLSCCSGDPAGCAATRLGSYGAMVYCRRNTAEPGHRGAGRLCSPETLKPVHHFPVPAPLATEGGGVDGR
jgi:hypothetical protein